MRKLNTDQGFNAYAVLVPSIGIISSMPDGTWKWVLLTIVSLVTGIVGIQTKGDTIETVDASEDLEDVLKDGRK
jgi:hypothetical protein